MSAETAEVLRRAKALIATPEKWCRGATARDAKGRPIAIVWSRRMGIVANMPPEAVALCAGGALLSVCESRLWEAAYAALRMAQGRVTDTVGEYNDARTHAEVMAWMDRTIAAEEVTP